MKKIVFVFAFLLVIAGCSPAHFIPSFAQTTIDWIDVVMWNDAKYTNNYDANKLDIDWQIGKELGEVTYMMEGHAGSNHKMKNGHAAYLTPGTKIYEMMGYDSSFRIIANGKVYEVSEPAVAKTAKLGDFLDFEGKVNSVWYASNYDGSLSHSMPDEVATEFIKEFLALEYVSHDLEHMTGERTLLVIRLKDGTSTRIGYWPEGNLFTKAFGTDRIQELLELNMNE